MNAINIYFLSRIEDCENFSLYEKRISGRPQPLTIREHEKSSLSSFVAYASCAGATISDFDSFYYSYAIPQIGKEFDLLKVTPESILNIELKSQEIEFEKIRTQLVRNKHYLRHTGRKIYSFTYTASTNEVYWLNDDEILEFYFTDVTIE